MSRPRRKRLRRPVSTSDSFIRCAITIGSRSRPPKASDSFSPDKRDAILGSLADLQPDSSNTFEGIDVGPDGSLVWLHWHRTAISDGNGNIVEIQSVGRDITEFKLVQETSRLERQRYMAIIEDQAEPILRFTPDGVRTFVNRAYCEFRQRSAEDLLGKTGLKSMDVRGRLQPGMVALLSFFTNWPLTITCGMPIGGRPFSPAL